ncbi:hypothetical protein [Hydrocarboniclastica marina]|uniref:Uncharacterized protein n=1 Tax=Hydrocarboniclastica marina TaxID=2259620 RepID=A0A4P7XE56_9ALTE|nr:hypothetical protein [Hydrocarboniclastica marina]MAL98779.1 hypothetical protein [Alteromonadaceae bacterium]QCF24664.1 hypothetical protein soil367_01100 [Hydrocarboniclastica marina]|tara:strand:+ start:4099 stop:4314 length:216 start_codon:yes stop_codon:yes gene_type:complete
MRPDEFMKKHGFDKDDPERDHSLRENAIDHARHLQRPNSGTPHDWEDWERFKRDHPDEIESPEADDNQQEE